MVILLVKKTLSIHPEKFGSKMRVHDSLKTPGISYHQVFLETLFETHICDYLPNLDASNVKINLYD